MTLRRALTATCVAVALLATTPAGAVSYTMDGQRTKSKTYNAALTQTAIPMSAATSTSQPFTPSLEDCTAATECDVRQLRLTLPRATSWGLFRATVRVPIGLNAALVLYDAEGQYLLMDDTVTGSGELDGDSLEYLLTISDDLMTAGRYQIAVVNRGGTGEFSATVEWVARRPDRVRR